MDHDYTVDVVRVGSPPYPCTQCGRLREEHDDPEGGHANIVDRSALADESGRRAGWARVAQLEEIVSVLNRSIDRMCMIMMEGPELEGDVISELRDILDDCEEVDPSTRPRWPGRLQPRFDHPSGRAY
jgi:hypothetical protein